MKVTFFGCAEYLRHHGYTREGELVFNELPRPVPTVAHIQERTAIEFGTLLTEMKSARRFQDVARPRQVAMYLARHFTARSLPEIGRMFGNRDHTTVIHAIKRIGQLREVDRDLNAHVRKLERELAQ